MSEGQVTNFTMNDKCATGTGKFLELMANTLSVDIKQLADMAIVGEDIEISSVCNVFAESEVISQLQLALIENLLIEGYLIQLPDGYIPAFTSMA